MKTIQPLLIALVFLLVACQSPPPASPGTASVASAPTSAPAATAAPVPTPAPAPAAPPPIRPYD